MKNKDKKFNLRTMNKRFLCIMIYAVLLVSCICICVLNTVTESYNIEVGDIAERTITAPHDVVDEYSTNQIKEEEMQKVAPIYIDDEDQTKLSTKRIMTAFTDMENIRSSSVKIYLSEFTSSAFNASDVMWKNVLSEEDMTSLRKLLPDGLDDSAIYSTAQMTKDKLDALRDITSELAGEELQSGIIYEDLSDACIKIKTKISKLGVYSNEQTQLAYEIVSQSLSANRVYDKEATEKARSDAAQAVEPVEYKEGENIVQKGEKITQKQYELIKQLGLTADTNSMTTRWIIAIIMLFLLFAVGYFYLSVNDKQYINNPKDALNISLLVLMTVLLAAVTRHLSFYILPVFLAVIVGASFMMRRMTIAFGCYLSILTALMLSPADMFIFNETVLADILSGVCGCTVAIMVLKKKQHRGEYILAGFLAGVVGSVVFLSYGISTGLSAAEMAKLAGTSVASGLVCGLVSVGVLPIWELLFSLATPSKLLELSNPGTELLKKLMIEAPGTYHHSAVTANLAEAGCEAIGANALLARVAAYYHDIGKMFNPKMFKENQAQGENPHDGLEPIESANILRNHVVFGAKLADKHKLPSKIKDIIIQHHGTSAMAYFLYEAKKTDPDVDEALFRYDGPRPQTVEAGVVMLADVVEAAVRANQSTLLKGDYAPFIRKLIKGKYDDGQLDMCPMNRRDLELVSLAFVNVYEAANHERILYPEDNK